MINKPVRLLIALLLMSFVFTCRYLPFDKELELAAATIPKLTLEATIGPIQVQNWCVYDDEYNLFFMPDKDNFSTGFMLRSSANGNIDIRYLYSDGKLSDNTWSYHIEGANPYKPNGLIETLAGAQGYLLVILYDYKPAQEPTYRILGANMPPNYTIAEAITEVNLLSDIGGAPLPKAVNGAFIKPNPDSTSCNLYVLYTDPTNQFREKHRPLVGASLGAYTDSRPGDSPANANPDYPIDLFYTFDPNTLKSFISYPQSDGFHNEYWETDTKQSFADKYPRLRILNNGNLLSMDKGVMYGFDQSGNQLYKFPLGELKYMYEMYSSTRNEYRMIFVLTQIEVNDYDTCKPFLTFRIYSYPTNDVAKLNF